MNANLEKVKAVFLEALDKYPPDQWGPYLDEACGEDRELRRNVQVLLDAHESGDSLLDKGAIAAGATIDQPLIERPGTVIGRYKLKEQIGEGGMGVVYVAEQTEPVRRKVALKIIKPGMDSRQVIGRFEAERQALALMDHPNIAKVFDAGTTGEKGVRTHLPERPEGCSAQMSPDPFFATGRPYFVMELVRGMPITDYCDQVQLGTDGRLELFTKVCQAVQHAHQKGIIHRDIKPSNVMVTLHDGTPIPKVIDFGVAKAINQRLTEESIYTQLTEMIGTPLYMSPEQAELSSLDIDTRSDVYSLGVLLYELLTGTTPFDKATLREAGYDEIRRIIRQQEPPKPSDRLGTVEAASLSTISEQRGIDPRKLTHTLRGDLDWIVMKALEKDRTRRYETANGFAADIERYLKDEPVEACPPSAVYKFKKFARRNKATITTASVVAVALIIGIIGTTWQAVRATREQRRANQLLTSERLARRQLVAIKTRESQRSMRINAEIEAALQEAERLQAQAKWSEALANVTRAMSLVSNSGSSEQSHPRVREQLKDLNAVLRLEEIRLQCRSVRVNDSMTDHSYAAAFQQYGIEIKNQDTRQAAARILASSVRDELITALDHWALVRKRLKDHDGRQRLLAVARAADAEPWRNRLRDVLEPPYSEKEKVLQLAASAPIRELSPATVVSLARLLHFEGETEQSIALLRQAQRARPNDFWINLDLGYYLHNIKPPRWDDSIRFSAIAVALRPENDIAHYVFARSLHGKGAFDEAADAFGQVIAMRSGSKKSNVFALFGLASSLHELKQWDRSAVAYADALDQMKHINRHGLPGPWMVIAREDELFTRVQSLRPNDHRLWSLRARYYAFGSHWDRAAADYARGVQARPLEDDSFEYACVLLLLGDKQGYRQLFNELLDAASRKKDSGAYLLGRASVISPRWAAGQEQMLQWANKAVALQGSPDTRRAPFTVNVLAMAHYRAGQFDLAIQFATESDQLYESWNRPNRAVNWPLLAMAHHRRGHIAQSRRWLDEALRWDEQMSDEDVENNPMHVQEFLEFKVLIREAVELMAANPQP